MGIESLNDLRAFHRVALERNFTRAAAQLGMSRSGLSHAITALEAKLGVRLLMRTTRSVSLTEAGQRLLNTLQPMLSELDSELAAIRSLNTKPAGTVRITANDHAINSVLWPRLQQLLKNSPDINVELSVDYGLTDIVAQQFDAGVRVGDIVDKDMIAVRIGPDFKMAVVGSKDYFADKPYPLVPSDLTSHNCINLRLPTLGGLYAWDFEKEGKSQSVRVTGQTVFNNTYLMLQGALDGLGLAYVPFNLVAEYTNHGQLKSVLQDWWPTFPGYHLYYANRRQVPPALSHIIEALRFKHDKSMM
ncbi:LysR family transcriptional regulator [Pantoea endophytica]|uniref:LysR family transcriptional regulator n=1 Tax=Pantoea endophytica TaxID=92488 RepID=UPI003016AB7A